MTTTPLPALTVADLPLTSAMAASSIHYPRFLQLLNDSVAAGAIANVTHGEIKQHFGRALEALWERQVSAPFFYGRGGNADIAPELWDFYYGDSTALHRLEATLAKVNASRLQHPAIGAMRAVLTEFLPVAERIAFLKERIVKRRAKSAEEREAEERFIPTPATPAATRYVGEVLSQVTRRNEDRMVDYLLGEYLKRLDIFMASSASMRKKLMASFENRIVVNAATQERDPLAVDYVLRSDFKNALKDLARDETLELRDRFIFKVVSKLAPIVEAKGNLAQIQEVSNTIQLGRLSGMLDVQFADGSRFLADNNVVYSHSVRFKPFVRFPLTFHSVVLADGSKMKQPSEERMHTIFCAAGEVDQREEHDDVEDKLSDAPR